MEKPSQARPVAALYRVEHIAYRGDLVGHTPDGRPLRLLGDVSHVPRRRAFLRAERGFESGNVGIYRDSGEVRQGLVDEILTQIPEDKIIWEAPQKAQQVWFIKLIGANVSLGNIAPAEVIPLETLRLGIRSDTFDHFLNL